MPDAIRDALRTACEPLSLRIPALAFRDEALNGIASAHLYQLEARIEWSGYVLVRLTIMEANFSALWTNPIWLCDPVRERVQAMNLVKQAINATPFAAEALLPKIM